MQRRESWSGHAPTRDREKAKPPRYAGQTTRLRSVRRWSAWPWQSPVGLNDFLSVSQRSLPVLDVQADAHGLVHHVQHIHVTVLKHGAHLLLAELADLQQLARGCCGVKEMTGGPTQAGRAPKAGWVQGVILSIPPIPSPSEKVSYTKPTQRGRNHVFFLKKQMGKSEDLSC